MLYPIIIRLWLVEETPSESETLAKRRKLLNPKMDGQTAKQYVQIRGHDAFVTANLIPPELIQLVTLRQEINPECLAKESSAQGFYAHGEVEITSEIGLCYWPGGRSGCFESRQLFATARNIFELKEAYELFREGRLPCASWTKTKTRRTEVAKTTQTEKDKDGKIFQCPQCLADVRVDTAGIQHKKMPKSDAEINFFTCPNCGRNNPIELSGNGTSAIIKEDGLSIFLGVR